MRTSSLHGVAPPAEKKCGLEFRPRRVWLPRLWWLWAGGATLVGSFLAVVGPLTPFTGLEEQYVALTVIPFMMVILAGGLTWLVLRVNTAPRRRRSEARSRPTPHAR